MTLRGSGKSQFAVYCPTEMTHPKVSTATPLQSDHQRDTQSSLEKSEGVTPGLFRVPRRSACTWDAAALPLSLPRPLVLPHPDDWKVIVGVSCPKASRQLCPLHHSIGAN